VADIDEPMVLERSDERAQTLYPGALNPEPVEGESGEPPPIPISAVEEEVFELEAAYEAPVRGDFPAETAPPPAASAGTDEGEAAGEFDFDLESSSTAPVPVVRLEPAAEEETPWLERGVALEREDASEANAPVLAAPAPPAPEPAPQVTAANGAATAVAPAGQRPAEIASTTLAELYFAQGLRDRAAQTYREILRREPDNTRARQRLGEIEALGAGGAEIPAPTGGAPGPGGGEAALQHTIARLEAFLEVVRRARA
jgi:hypothetical protein